MYKIEQLTLDLNTLLYIDGFIQENTRIIGIIVKIEYLAKVFYLRHTVTSNCYFCVHNLILMFDVYKLLSLFIALQMGVVSYMSPHWLRFHPEDNQSRGLLGICINGLCKWIMQDYMHLNTFYTGRFVIITL